MKQGSGILIILGAQYWEWGDSRHTSTEVERGVGNQRAYFSQFSYPVEK